MTKKTLHSIAILLSLYAVSCYAAPISFQPPPSTSTTNNAASSQLQPVLSPEDFKKKVQSKAQKTQDDLSKQVNKLLPAKPPQVVIPGASTAAPAPPGANTPPPSLPQNETAPGTPPKEAGNLPEAPPPAEAAAPAPLQQNQSYTGFIGTTPEAATAGGPGAHTPEGNKGSVPESKPWKIQY